MTEYYMKAWKGNELEEYQIKVCCERLSKEKEIGKLEDHWDCYGDGVYQIENILYCPFCGSELP